MPSDQLRRLGIVHNEENAIGSGVSMMTKDGGRGAIWPKTRKGTGTCNGERWAWKGHLSRLGLGGGNEKAIDIILRLGEVQ